jgi:hypothetical protein
MASAVARPMLIESACIAADVRVVGTMLSHVVLAATLSGRETFANTRLSKSRTLHTMLTGMARRNDVVWDLLSGDTRIMAAVDHAHESGHYGCVAALLCAGSQGVRERRGHALWAVRGADGVTVVQRAAMERRFDDLALMFAHGAPETLLPMRLDAMLMVACGGGDTELAAGMMACGADYACVRADARSQTTLLAAAALRCGLG